MPSKFVTTKIDNTSVGSTDISSSQNDYVKTTNYLVITANTVSLTGVVAGQNGEVLVIESSNPLTSNAVIIPNESSSSSANNRFTSLDGANIYLYFGDRCTFVYLTSTNRWVLKEIFRNQNEHSGTLTSVASTGGTPPVFDNKLYTTIFSENLCRVDIFIDASISGVNNTLITFDLPPSVPTGATDPSGSNVFFGIVALNGNFNTGQASPLVVNGTTVSVTTNPIAFDTLQANVIIPIKGNLGF